MEKIPSVVLIVAAALLWSCGQPPRNGNADATPARQEIEVREVTARTPAAGMTEVSPRAAPATTTRPGVVREAPSTTRDGTTAVTSPSQAMTPLRAYYRPVAAHAQIAGADAGPVDDTTSRPALIQVESREIGTGPTLAGLDVLQRQNFERLKGRKVALLTNHSAIDRQGRHILDLMVGHPNVQLVKLFSPEHGLYGNVDTKTPDAKDTATGLMVHSLYSNRNDGTKSHHPRRADLEGVDAVVVDMQDIGASYYTYPAYMAFMMEECTPLGIEVIVLDRPNPLGGLYVDGSFTDDDLLGGVTTYMKVPIAHGMTIGELARMYNAEKAIGCKLTVIPMENWSRSMLYDQTGLRWVNPSPNIQDLDAALVYPGIGMLEAQVSMGRGTTEPFHIFGMPYIGDPEAMCKAINSSGIAGVRLEPMTFTPTGKLARGHLGENQLCRGARIVITDRVKFRPYELGLRVMYYLEQNYGPKAAAKSGATGATRFDAMASRGMASTVVCARVREGKPIDSTLEFVTSQVQKFMPVRERYLLYK